PSDSAARLTQAISNTHAPAPSRMSSERRAMGDVRTSSSGRATAPHLFVPEGNSAAMLAPRAVTAALEAIQKRALAEGLPYQTLIASLLHKYASGRLKEV
ncbi:MAG TPA: hypothetical protein VFS56_09895, partial [Gemmatimonadaceae bacterium]|nr:hypothetical protein [Gemmatimonadaceae bacterium]